MKWIFGLGNPGNRYRNTRHNVGFMVLEYLAGRWNAVDAEGFETARVKSAVVEGSEIMLVQPQTYMNNSGESLSEIRARYDVPLESVLTIYDDFQLPFGTLRFRPSGSDGGHNGLASMIGQAQNNLIPRLRIGVGGSTMPVEHTHEMMAAYVLAPFDPDEEERIPELLKITEQSIRCWVTTGIQRTMSLYNRNFFTSAKAE